MVSPVKTNLLVSTSLLGKTGLSVRSSLFVQTGLLIGATTPSLTPVNTIAPVLSVSGGGPLQVGSTVVGTSGTWTGASWYSYQLNSNDVPIFSLISSSNVVPLPALGGTLTLTVKGFSAIGAVLPGVATSNSLGPVLIGPQSGLMTIANSAGAAYSVASTAYYAAPNARSSANSLNVTRNQAEVLHHGASITFVAMVGDVVSNARTTGVTLAELTVNGVATGFKLIVSGSTTIAVFSGAPVTVNDGDLYCFATNTGSGSGNLVPGQITIQYTTAGQIFTPMIGGQAVNRNANLTLFSGIAGGYTAPPTSGGEAIVGTVMLAAGTLSNWQMWFSANTFNTGQAVYTLRVNGVDTLMTFSVPVAGFAAGRQGDTTHTVNVNAGDVVTLRYDSTSAASGAISEQLTQINFTPSTANVFPLYAGGPGVVLAASLTRWCSPQGLLPATETTETPAQLPMLYDSVASLFGQYITTNTLTSDGAITLRGNGSNLTLTKPITAGVANTLFQDATHTDTVRAGIKLAIQETTGTGTSAGFGTQSLLLTTAATPLYLRPVASATYPLVLCHDTRLIEAYGGSLCDLSDGTNTITGAANPLTIPKANGLLDTVAILAALPLATNTNPVRLTKRYNQGSLGSAGDETLTHVTLNPSGIEPDGHWPANYTGFSAPSVGSLSNGSGTVGAGFSYGRGDHSVVVIAGPISNVAISGSGPQIALVSLGSAADGNRVDIVSGNNNFNGQFGLGAKVGTTPTVQFPATALRMSVTRNVIMETSSTVATVDTVAAPNINFRVNGSSQTQTNTGQTAGTGTGMKSGIDQAGNNGGMRHYATIVTSAPLVNATQDDRANVEAQLKAIFSIPTTAMIQGLFPGSSSTTGYRTYGEGFLQQTADQLGPQFRIESVSRAGTNPSVIAASKTPIFANIDQVNYNENFIGYMGDADAISANELAINIWNNDIVPMLQEVQTAKPGTTFFLMKQPGTYSGTAPQNVQSAALVALMANPANQALYNYIFINIGDVPQLMDTTNLTYFDPDQHMNQLGCFYAAQALVPVIQAYFPT